jgi:hypothetical protein
MGDYKFTELGDDPISTRLMMMVLEKSIRIVVLQPTMASVG